MPTKIAPAYMPAISGRAATIGGVPPMKRSPRPPRKASTRSRNQVTPAGKPTITARRSSVPPGCPWKSMCSPWARW